LILEDWETGDFSRFDWETRVGGDWSTVTTSPYEGSYCAESGNISDDQITSLILRMDVSTAGNLSFYKKVSSQSSDYLRFYIDGTLQDSWSGTVAWSQESYSIGTGIHTLRWSFEKDGSTSSGSDCAWVDYIVFPPANDVAPTAIPYSTNFDNSGALPADWYYSTMDFDWVPRSGSTPSSSTGPSGDHTTGSGYYVYTEATSPNFPTKHAYIITPSFDFTSLSDAQLSFWYHMYGSGMGELHLDLYSGGSWTNDVMTTISGDQGNSWQQRTVDLTAYVGGEVKLRFRGITGSSYTSDICIDDFDLTGTIVVPSVQLDLKAFLEGPFSVTDMYRWLNSYNYMPLAQPYNVDPFYYAGSESVASIPSVDIVDWILVEIRETVGTASSATSATTIGRQAGFIMKNGDIVAVDGSSLIEFSLSVNNNLYAIVWHRNHLGIMTSGPLPNVGNVYSWDFTTDVSKTFGGFNAHKEIEPGIWGMISGDGDSDGQVTTSDKLDVWWGQSGMSGYLFGDFNMNGNSDNTDKIEYWGVNAGRGTHVPD